MRTHRTRGLAPQRPAHLLALLFILSSTSISPASEAVVVAWGFDEFGDTIVPGGLSNVVAVAAGGAHSLALSSDGTVTAWGWNSFFQSTVPAGASNAVAIAAGEEHSLAVRSDGTVVGWGSDFMPDGIGGLVETGQATPPAGLSNVVAVAAGAYHSAALRRDGRVVMWGWIGGPGTLFQTWSNVVAISAGPYSSAALKSDGAIVVTWLGSVSAGSSNVVAIATGGSFFNGDDYTIALRGDGTVVGQVGWSNVVALAAGYEHSVFLRSDGTVAVHGSSNSCPEMLQTDALSNVVAIAAGGYHGLVVLRQDSIPMPRLELARAGPEFALRAHGTPGISAQLLRATQLEGPWLPALPVTFTNALHTIPVPNRDEPAQFFRLHRQ